MLCTPLLSHPYQSTTTKTQAPGLPAIRLGVSDLSLFTAARPSVCKGVARARPVVCVQSV